MHEARCETKIEYLLRQELDADAERDLQIRTEKYARELAEKQKERKDN